MSILDQAPARNCSVRRRGFLTIVLAAYRLRSCRIPGTSHASPRDAHRRPKFGMRRAIGNRQVEFEQRPDNPPTPIDFGKTVWAGSRELGLASRRMTWRQHDRTHVLNVKHRLRDTLVRARKALARPLVSPAPSGCNGSAASWATNPRGALRQCDGVGGVEHRAGSAAIAQSADTVQTRQRRMGSSGLFNSGFHAGPHDGLSRNRPKLP